MRHALFIIGIITGMAVDRDPDRPIVAKTQADAQVVARIKAKMSAMERYAAQNTGGYSNVGPLAGAKTARDFLLAHDATYQTLDALLQPEQAKPAAIAGQAAISSPAPCAAACSTLPLQVKADSRWGKRRIKRIRFRFILSL